MMPDYMQKIGNICPQRWAIGAIEKLQSGKSLVDVAPMLLSLVILSLALFLLSIFFWGGYLKENISLKMNRR